MLCDDHVSGVGLACVVDKHQCQSVNVRLDQVFLSAIRCDQILARQGGQDQTGPRQDSTRCNLVSDSTRFGQSGLVFDQVVTPLQSCPRQGFKTAILSTTRFQQRNLVSDKVLLRASHKSCPTCDQVDTNSDLVHDKVMDSDCA